MDYKSIEKPEFVFHDALAIASARASLTTSLPKHGQSLDKVAAHLKNDITQGLTHSAKSARYYGFVTGGSTTAAQLADNVVTEYDQSISVHFPDTSIATDVEYHALSMLCELIDLDPQVWSHKLFTTGATSSNLIGLAVGREYVIDQAAKGQDLDFSVARDGLQNSASIAKVQILATVAHSSLRKAASIVGLGHASVIDCGDAKQNYKFDMARLKAELAKPKTASIIMVSCCEVNAGMFALEKYEEWKELRELADNHGAWIHVDAAMGFIARVLSREGDFSQLRSYVDGLELADSITGDGHKLLNVPYDTGFFLSRHINTGMEVFQNPGAVYLKPTVMTIPSPMNIGIENSRRFRALPVYANFIAYGRSGYQDMLERQIRLARRVAADLYDSEFYELYQPRPNMSREEVVSGVFMIVMFRAKDASKNSGLLARINASRRIFSSGTVWDGQPAARIAVSNWMSDVDVDFPVIKEVLDGVAKNG